jgi:hypothetical protein
MRHRSVLAILATCLLACGGRSPSDSGAPDAAPDASSTSGCQPQLDDGGLSLAQCTCASVTASASSGTTVLAVYSTTSDAINPNYDLGLPSGTPVCFVSEGGEFQIPSPPSIDTDASATTYPYGFVIYTESPWRVVESGSGPTLQSPGSN